MQRAAPRIPVLVQLLGIVAAAMLLPALMALVERDFATARAFAYGAALVGFFCLLLSLTTRREIATEDSPSGQILSLLAVYALLPAAMALPLAQAVGVGFGAAWFEMVSATTTTGGTLLDQGQFVPRAVHFWRVLAGWMGGFFAWVMAVAVLAPMNLGGFEVRAPRDLARSARNYTELSRLSGPAARLARHAEKLLPIYAGLTGALFVLLLIAGDDEFVALCHAMSVMASSGISPVGGLTGASSGMLGEAFILLFFAFALARSCFTPTILGPNRVGPRRDPELHFGLALLFGAFVVLFGHHWLGQGGDGGNGVAAAWGLFFTLASFLSTTGFESDSWLLATFWSGLKTPGLALVGLAMIGGGVATTAGGVKLMRVYVLGQHLRSELDQMISPSTMRPRGPQAIPGHPQGAYIAWVLFMLFALNLALVMLLLAITGLPFEEAFLLALAALSNCGPLAGAAAEMPLSFADASGFGQTVLAAAMVAGRLEALALIALINREFWSR